MALKFEDLSARAQAAVIVGFSALLAGAAVWYFAHPVLVQRDALAAEVEQLHTQNVMNRVFEQQRIAYLRQLTELENQMQVLRSFVPDQQDVDGFIRMVRGAEATADVHVRTFVAQPVSAEKLYVDMPFKMRVDGSYYALLDFFDRLAHGPRIVSIADLSLGTPQGGGLGTYKVAASETVGANCTVTAYFSPGQTAPPKPAGKGTR